MANSREYEEILAELLFDIPLKVDTRVGSVAHAFMVPPAIKFALLHADADVMEENLSYLTASGAWLDLHAINSGLSGRIMAGQAQLLCITYDTGNRPTMIPERTKFVTAHAPTIFYTLLRYVNPELNDGVCIVECDSIGEIGNNTDIHLIPTRPIINFSSIVVGTPYLFASDRETDDELRERIRQAKQNRGSYGNIEFFQEKVPSLVRNIGRCMVIPRFFENNYTTLSLVDKDFRAISQQLQREAKAIIDPNDINGIGEGRGIGIAPVGMRIGVTTPREIGIRVKAVIEVSGTSLFDSVNPPVSSLWTMVVSRLKQYFKEVRENWGVRETIPTDYNYLYRTITVSRSRIEQILINTPNIENYESGLTVLGIGTMPHEPRDVVIRSYPHLTYDVPILTELILIDKFAPVDDPDVFGMPNPRKEFGRGIVIDTVRDYTWQESVSTPTWARSGNTIALSTITASTTILYTINGEPVTEENGIIYEQPFSIDPEIDVVLHAIAIRPDWKDSDMLIHTFRRLELIEP